MRGGLQVTGYGLQVTDYRLQVTGYRYQNNCKPVNLPTCGPENLNQTVDCQLRVIPAGSLIPYFVVLCYFFSCFKLPDF